jgi:ligand-binding sensor domain-containing protein
VIALWLLAGAAFGATVETMPSCAKVTRVAFDGEAAVVTARDGTCRFPLEAGASSLGPPTLAGCSYEPREDGLLRRCPRLADEVLPAGGFPVTSAAAYGAVMFVGTYGGGLRRMPSGERVPGTPDAVTALAASEQGLLVGTERGAYLFKEGTVRSLMSSGPNDGHVVKLIRGGADVWAAHFDRGVSRFQDGGWRGWGKAEGLPSEWLDDLAWDGVRLWGATEKGVFWIEGETVVRPPDERLRAATSALFVSSATVYLAQAGRILSWKDGVVAVLASPEQHPQRLLVLNETIWLAGLDGLWRFSEGTTERYGVIDGRLPGDWVTALAAGPQGLIVGTYDAGLALLGSTTSLKSDAWVNLGALDRDGERLAVGETAAGLSLWNGAAWSKLGTADGLPGEDVSAVLFDGPDLWVGTRTGLARVR